MKDAARFHWIIWLGAAAALVVLLLPVVIVVMAGLTAGEYLTFPPQGLSLRWVVDFLKSPTFFPAYLFSLELAVITMAISSVMGTMAAIYLIRSKSKSVAAMRGLFMSPIVLPGLVLGLALYVFYVATEHRPCADLRRFAGRPCAGHLAVRARHSVGLAGGVRPFAGGGGAQPRRGTVARLSASITLKIIWPAVAAGSIFAFIISFGQFDLSLYLGTPNLTGLPYAMYISLRYKFEPTAAAAGIFAIALVVVSMVLSSRLVNLTRLVSNTRLRW